MCLLCTAACHLSPSYTVWCDFTRWPQKTELAFNTATLRREKVRQWTFTIVQEGEIGLVCRMLWTVGEKEDAWKVLEKSRISAYSVDDHLRGFLEDFSDHDSARCIAVYRRFVDECIRQKSRNAYRDAASKKLPIDFSEVPHCMCADVRYV